MLSKISAVLVGLLLVLGLGVSASAYPGQDPAAVVSSGTVAPGGSVSFTASGFAPGSSVTLSVSGPGTSTSSSVSADGAGTVAQVVTLGSAVGTYTITATGTDGDGNPVSVSSTVLVSADAASGGSGTSAGGTGGTLARTGVDDVATIAWMAFGVLVLGGVLVAVASGRGRTRQTV